MKLAKILVVAMVGGLALGPMMGRAATAATNVAADDTIAKASATDVANFKSNPNSLLTSNPIGGIQLAAMAKSLALADPSTVQTLIELIGSTNPLQLAAIGSGLGQAAKALKNSSDPSDQQAAETINTQISAAKNQTLQTAFNSGSTGTASVDGKSGTQQDSSASSDAGGGVGGVVNLNGNGSGSSNGGTGSGSGTTSSPTVGNITTANTTEPVQFSGTSKTCQSSVSPTRVC